MAAPATWQLQHIGTDASNVRDTHSLQIAMQCSKGAYARLTLTGMLGGIHLFLFRSGV